MPVIDHATCAEVEMRPGIRGQFLADKSLGSEGVSLLGTGLTRAPRLRSTCTRWRRPCSC